MSRTSVVTVVCSCLISSLYLSSFSCALLWVSIKCCMMSFIVTSLGASLFLSLLGIGLPSAWRLVSLPSFSALLVNILVAVGETLFLGVASTDAESESLVNRLSRLGGLPSAPPCGPSLFLFSAWSPSLVVWSLFPCSSAPLCPISSRLPSLAIPPPLAPPRLFGAGISTPHRGALLETRENHQEALLQLVV